MSKEVLLAVAVLAIFQGGCGSCVGEATPTEKTTQPTAPVGPGVQRALKTTTTENRGITLDGTTAESMQKDE